MPGFDATGPTGYGPMTGGRRRGYRNQYHATGLTGWQRAHMGVVPEATPGTDRIALIEQRLDEALARLTRLERVGTAGS